MPFDPYSYDLSTLIGQVRLLAGETDQAALTMTGGDRTRTDTEIDALLTLQGRDVRLAAATLLEGKAAEFAQAATNITQGGVRQDFRVRSQRLLEAAALLRDAAGAPVVFSPAADAGVLGNGLPD
ncbi:MAG: hypothetical protein ABJA67_14190 [Chthonomonadales bacterium]